MQSTDVNAEREESFRKENPNYAGACAHKFESFDQDNISDTAMAVSGAAFELELFVALNLRGAA